ncbi:kgd2 [Symbiodinium sp. KB8]|nr:kgd2 [Symbiodinium sp. KB8]
MALWFLFSFLALTFGEASSERFDEYVKDAERGKVFTESGSEWLRAAVKNVEEQNEDKVVLYHVLPLNGYLMAWLVHGITANQSLQWQNTPGVSAELKFSLRHFKPGMSFPSFTRHNASLCVSDWYRKVREADPNTAKVLGDGDWSNYIGFKKPYKITYSTTSKEYYDCHALVYSELVEDNNKNGPLLEEKALADAHVRTAKQFAEYLDVGEKWQDINLLGRAGLGEKQHRTPSMWAYFTTTMHVYDDLNADHVTPQIWKLQKVSNLLSLLKCAAQMRFPIYQTNFHRRTQIMKHCWEGDRQPFPPDLPLMSLDGVASKRTKDATIALETGGLPTDKETRGFSRVLLQVVLSPDVANDLAYVSTDWFDRTGPAPGHQHKDWKAVSFMDAYKVLKNTVQGDEVTARVLLKRDWGLAPSDTPESVKIIATSPAFADSDFMEFAASVLEDIRNCVLQHPQTPKKKTGVWPWWVLELKVVVPVLCLGLLACLGYIGCRRKRTQAPATGTATRDVELRLA